MTEILLNFVSMPLVVWQQTANQLGPVSVPVLFYIAYEDRVSFDAHVFRRPKCRAWIPSCFHRPRTCEFLFFFIAYEDRVTFDAHAFRRPK